MEKNEIEKLITVRSHLLGFYNALDAKNEPSGVVKQSSAANEIEVAIKKIDSILEKYVNFS